MTTTGPPITTNDVLDLIPLEDGEAGRAWAPSYPLPVTLNPATGQLEADVSALVAPGIVAVAAVHYAASRLGISVAEVVFDLRAMMAGDDTD